MHTSLSRLGQAFNASGCRQKQIGNKLNFSATF